MTVEPQMQTIGRAMLEAEWTRVGHLVALAEATRTGGELGEAFSNAFDRVAEDVAEVRRSGAWSGLAALLPAGAENQIVAADLDLLAIALAVEARPMLAGRLHSLQPQIGGPHPSLGLLQELLMLESEAEIAQLYDRLGPAAPLVAYDLVRIAGDGAYQTVRLAPAVARAVLGRDTALAPPPGANLAPRRAGWDELILPPKALRSLNDFTSWIRFSSSASRDWSAVSGPLALFCGPSGTGKTFAASVVAADLEAKTGEPWALYALDLGRIMSKYVGETEQNLNALLDALHGRRAILQIDEADGLLGKRGEISDARDRYANLEVSHMLSRFERHAGPVILTTNLRSNIDAAFLRRFQLVVDFPSPDAAARARLWSTLLPKVAPLDPSLSIAQLGETVRLSGGGILNAATYAAILAVNAGQPIGPTHLARAVWAELNKDSRQVRQSEIGFLAEYLEEDEL